jgi:hypothetical protein
MDHLNHESMLNYLCRLSPADFEHALARLIPHLGYGNVRHTGGAGDLGVDIVCADAYGGLVAVQCKRYAQGNKITSPDIQHFFAMIVHHGARHGIYVTTSSFTKSALDLAAARDITAIDGVRLSTLFSMHLDALPRPNPFESSAPITTSHPTPVACPTERTPPESVVPAAPQWMFWRRNKNRPEPASKLAPKPQPTILDEDWQGEVVRFTDDGTIAYKVNSLAEAKLAIKQMKLRKKEIVLEKREITQAVTAINAERRARVANQGRMMRGGGEIAKFTRSMQSLSRDMDKRNYAARLRPYELEKALLEDYALNVDRMIAELEVYLHQQGE